MVIEIDHSLKLYRTLGDIQCYLMVGESPSDLPVLYTQEGFANLAFLINNFHQGGCSFDYQEPWI